MSNNIKFLAYYLPQYHPIPENDKWWGKGFTEWTNVTKAKPLFKGHRQPILPAELGFYDLRLPEVQRAQAELAFEYGIDGFIYYQYWFGNNNILLQKPAEQMLQDKSIKIPYCFCWANETWKGIWHGLDNPSVLIQQLYNGELGYIEYFNYLLPFFKDERYIKIDNKPMFHVYRFDDIPDIDIFISIFNSLAVENGFGGVYLIANGEQDSAKAIDNPFVNGIIGLNVFNELRYKKKKKLFKNILFQKIENRIKYYLGSTDVIGQRKKPLIVDYSKAVRLLNIKFPNEKHIACVLPNWDNSARSGAKSLVFSNSNPTSWKVHLGKAVSELKKNLNNPPFIVIKSWNEWAEGNRLEPDLEYGRKWLEVVKEVKAEINN